MESRTLAGTSTLVSMYSQPIGRLHTICLKTSSESLDWIAEITQLSDIEGENKTFTFPVREITRDRDYLKIELYTTRPEPLPAGLNSDLVVKDRRISVTSSRIKEFKYLVDTCSIENVSLKEIQIAAYESIIRDLTSELEELNIERDKILNANI